MLCNSQVLFLQHNVIIPFAMIKLMRSEYRKQRAKTQPVIPEQEIDSLRVLAKIIARRHIMNQLNKIEGRNDKKNINSDNDNKTSNG